MPLDDRRRALEALESRKPAELQQLSQELLPILRMALGPSPTRRVAASLLVKLDIDQARNALTEALPMFAETLQDEGRPRAERVESVLALTEMGAKASDSVPAWPL